jgi:pyridoxamine 5'-phosphate oxidase
MPAQESAARHVVDQLSETTTHALAFLRLWLCDAQSAVDSDAIAMGLSTVGPDGRPTARVVSLKLLEDDSLVFTTALWTRKARELEQNPNVALLFHWPELGHQVQITGRAVLADRGLAKVLFAERERSHRLQTLVSRQGEPIEDLGPLRERLRGLEGKLAGRPVPCPPDWGAVRVFPDAVEFWQEAADRLHDRLLYERIDGGWRRTRLAP